MSDRVTNILLVGVGGQGILLASEILAETFMLAGFDVKKSEIHGMSQRGGSVVSHVRFGREVFSPLVPEGEGDILLGFELIETLRYLTLLKKDGSVIANDLKILPSSVLMGKEVYPDNVPELVRQQFPQFLLVDGQEIARQAGNLRAANTALLGAVSRRLQIGQDYWMQALERMVPRNALDVNRRAFLSGREL